MFDLLTYAGVAFMLYVGMGEVRAGLSTQASKVAITPAHLAGGFGYVRRGLIVNLLNPKVGLFYLSFLPQFVADGDLTVKNVLLLGGIHILLGILWLSACSLPVHWLLIRRNRC